MWRRIFVPLGALICLHPSMSSFGALALGVAIALAFGNPFLDRTRWLTRWLLAISIVGLGAGMNLYVVWHVGLQGIQATVATILVTFFLGLTLGKLFSTSLDVSTLISAGTAICGGSAIAAVASAIRAKDHDITVALGTVFVLNAMALLIFPIIGHHLGMDETRFGLWSALAIHDTSSVVGATLHYGPQALAVGTAVKLARALWIAPLTFLISFTRKTKDQSFKFNLPWFILGFILSAAVVSYWPALQPAGHVVEAISKRLLIVTLYLIGTGLTLSTLKTVGVRPFVQGFVLWIFVAGISLAGIQFGWLHV